MSKKILILVLTGLFSVTAFATGTKDSKPTAIEPKEKTSAIPGTLGASQTKTATSNFEAGDNTLKQAVSTQAYDRLSFSQGKVYQTHKDVPDPAYLKLAITRSNRLTVTPDKRIKFKIKPGKLEDNINELLSHTVDGTAYFPQNFPASIRMYNDFSITGDSVLAIIDTMIEPWADSRQLWAETHINNVIEFKIN